MRKCSFRGYWSTHNIIWHSPTPTSISSIQPVWVSTVQRPIRHIIGHFGDDFMGQMTQPTVSQHWRLTVSQPGQGPILKTQRRLEDRELNQARSKPNTVDQPVRTARILVHHYNSTQYCNTETVFSIFPFLQTNITSQMWPSGGKGHFTTMYTWPTTDQPTNSQPTTSATQCITIYAVHVRTAAHR